MFDLIEPWDRGEWRAFLRLVARVVGAVAVVAFVAIAFRAAPPNVADHLPQLNRGEDEALRKWRLSAPRLPSPPLP
jgi:hypothetical protein